MSVANENLHHQAAHNSRLDRRLLCLLLLLVATGCGRRVHEYTLIDAIATNVREPDETPEVVQDSAAHDDPGALSDASTVAANRSVSPAPSVSEDSDSVEGGTPKTRLQFRAPQQLDTGALGQTLLRRGLANRDSILVIAAVKILSTTSDPGSNTSFSERLENAQKLAEADDTLVPLLIEHVRGYFESGQSQTVQDANEQWEIGSHGLTDVGLGEIVFRYGVKREDYLSRAAGLLLLAGAVQQEGTLTPKELHQRTNTLLNEVNEPIWTMLADRIDDVIHRRAEQRPGEDWPTFLGPTADGRSAEVQLIQRWPSLGPPMVWQFDAGHGFAACSVRDGRLYFFDQVNHHNRLVCMNQATGDIRGEFTYPAPAVSPGGYQGPRCSPVVDEDRVYLLDEAGVLHCLRVGSNDVIWKTDTAKDFDVTANRFGVAATPRVVGDLLVAIVGGGRFDSSSSPSNTRAPKPNGSALVAFDKLTGKVAYASGNFLADYASPVTADIQGVQWGFALLREGLVGFAPATGQITSNYPWSAEGLSSANCTSPVVVGDEVFVSNAFGRGSALLKVEPSRLTPIWVDDFESAEKNFEAYFSTPVYHDGYLYGCSGKDSHHCELRCINWRTGEVMWSKPGLNRVSLILANGQLICLSEYGVLYLVEATPDEYRLVSTVTLKKWTPGRLPPSFAVPNLLEYPCWTAPVLSRGYLYLRSPNKLVCLDLSLTEAIDLQQPDQQQPTSDKARVAEIDAEDDTSRSPASPSATAASPDRPDAHAHPGSSRGELLIDSRTWTDSEGSTFDAAVIMIRGDKVTFLWSDGKEGERPTANLTDADQELIDIVRRLVDK